jgi:hypothetical protein
MHTPAPAEPEYDPAGHAAQEEPPAGEPSKGRSQARMQQRAEQRRGRMKRVGGEISEHDAHSGEGNRRRDARPHAAGKRVDGGRGWSCQHGPAITQQLYDAQI